MHSYVGSLRAMRALHQLKFDHIALVQVAISLTDNRRVVDKDVWAPRGLDETVPLYTVEPYHLADHSFRSESHPQAPRNGEPGFLGKQHNHYMQERAQAVARWDELASCG